MALQGHKNLNAHNYSHIQVSLPVFYFWIPLTINYWTYNYLGALVKNEMNWRAFSSKQGKS